MTLEKFIYDPWVVGIGTILIASFIWDLYKEKKDGAIKLTFSKKVAISIIALFIVYRFDDKILPDSYQFLAKIIQSVISIISNNLIVIYWIIGSLAFIIVLYILDIIHSNIKSAKEPKSSITTEEYNNLMIKEKLKKKLSFIAKRFGDFIWKWEWIYNDLIKDWEVKRFKPCCPDPDCKDSPLELDLAGKIYTCPICKQGNIIDQSPYDIQKLVEKEVKYRESFQYEIEQKFEKAKSTQRFT